MWSPTSWDMHTATLCCELAGCLTLFAREGDGLCSGLVVGPLREVTRGACRGQIPTRPLSAWVPLVANDRWSLVPSTNVSRALIERGSA